jgi:hypothetical protein
MSVTFVKRNKPTDKSWQVVLQGKVRVQCVTRGYAMRGSTTKTNHLFVFFSFAGFPGDGAWWATR